MELLSFANIVQVIYGVGALATLLFAFLLGTRYEPSDRSVLKVLFCIGLLAGGVSTIAIASNAPIIMGAGLFVGAFLMGLSLGMNAIRRTVD